MRKLNLIFFLGIILLIAGCKKTSSEVQNVTFDNTPITSQSAAKQVAYENTKKGGYPANRKFV